MFTRIPLPSRQEFALILVTVFWGATFLIIHNAMAVSGPLFFVGLRFACATVSIGLLAGRNVLNITAHEVKAGTLIGLCLFVGYGLQTCGLQTISSSKSAFITAMYVPLTPLLQWLIMRRRPQFMNWVGVALAFFGLMLLAGPNEGLSFTFGHGELLTAVSTIGIALEIVFISVFAGFVDIRRVTVVQLMTTSILAFALMPVFGESVPPFSWTLVLSACSLGLMSAVIQLTMNWAQRQVTPTRATLIYSGEAVWAGIFGRMAGERLPGLAFLGAALILTGVLISEFKPRNHRTPQTKQGGKAA